MHAPRLCRGRRLLLRPCPPPTPAAVHARLGYRRPSQGAVLTLLAAVSIELLYFGFFYVFPIFQLFFLYLEHSNIFFVTPLAPFLPRR